MISCCEMTIIILLNQRQIGEEPRARQPLKKILSRDENISASQPEIFVFRKN